MSEALHLTILFDLDEDGWIVASVPQVPGAHSQGKTQDEARENVLDALAGLLDLRASAHERTGQPIASESLDVVVRAA
jgi:predicted RNase H-like HicB family nuclease